MENETKTITIKEALVSDKEYIDLTMKTKGVKQSEALHIIVEEAQTCRLSAENVKANISEIERLQAEETRLNDEIERIIGVNKKYLSELEKIGIALNPFADSEHGSSMETLSKVIELAQKPAQGIVKEVEKSTAENEIIIAFTRENFVNARKLRTFVQKEGFIEDSENPSELVNVALSQFFKRHFSDHLR